MTTNSRIQTIVLRRAHRIHALRTSVPLVFSAALAAVAVWGIGREVWVARVFQNMPSWTDVGAVLRFYTLAYFDTHHHMVQALVLLALAAVVWFAYALLRQVRFALYQFT